MRILSLTLALALPLAAAAQSSGYVTTSDSARLYYIVAGRPAPGADTLIAIHGGPGMDLESIYGDFAGHLAQKHVVIFYDQRGGGKSELPADTSRLVAARQIQDLDEIRQHFGLQQMFMQSLTLQVCEEWFSSDLFHPGAATSGRGTARI